MIPSATHTRNGQRATVTVPLAYANSYSRVKNFLKDMLRETLKLLQKGSINLKPVFADLSRAQIVDGLRTQLEAYWRDEWPFNQPVKDNDPLSWWKTLAEHPYAQVLAVHVKLFCFCLFHLSTN